MKKLLTIFGFLLCAFTISAQKDFLYKAFTIDTLTDAETVYFTFPTTMQGLYEYQFQIQVDSLSGNTAGTVYVQSASDRKGTNYVNVTSKTYTVVGAATQTGGFITGVGYGTNYRLAVVGTGTQSTKLTVSAVFKKIGGGAQSPDFDYKAFTVDSTDAAESIYFTFPGNLQGRYYYSWQVVYDEVSGSATSTAQLQEASDNSGSRWFNKSGITDAKTDDGSSLFEGTCYGSNQRMKLTQSTTGKWRYTVYVTYKKIK